MRADSASGSWTIQQHFSAAEPMYMGLGQGTEWIKAKSASEFGSKEYGALPTYGIHSQAHDSKSIT